MPIMAYRLLPPTLCGYVHTIIIIIMMTINNNRKEKMTHLKTAY